ncbi:hypothetical protein KR009_001864 [Drosophila setifemur]|nr:hypothetical protein KR009_001864 [Drosophila setifemur]
MENFTKYANFFYTTLGIEPYSKGVIHQRNELRDRIVFWANVINLSAVLFGNGIYVCIAFKEGKILEAVTVMSYIGFDIVGTSKMIFILWKKPVLNAMITELEEMHPRGKVQEKAFNLQDYLRTCSRISVKYSLLYLILIWTFNLFSIMDYLISEKWLHLRVVGRTLPYAMYLPWELEDSWSFYPLLISQNLAGYTAAAGQISTDLLICAVATMVVMHFKHLSTTLEHHELSGNWERDSRFLADTVRYHERLLRLSDVVNDIFGVPLLLNFMVSSFVICFVGFQMTAGISPDKITKLFLFLISAMSQVYLICHCGQRLADASSGLSVSAYRQNWNHADIRYKSALVLIISRAQKVTYLKATIFLDITRSSMTILLQVSYKFFALLRTMYGN